MDEFFDIYDINRNNTGRTGKRYSYIFKEGEYLLVTDVFIFNSKEQLLLTRRAPNKTNGLMWEATGGLVTAGEDSKEAIIREIKEEIGLKVKEEELILLKQLRRDEKILPRYKDIWILKRDINLGDLVLQEEEVIDAKWVNLDEFREMFEMGQIVKTIDFNKQDYEKSISLLKFK